MSGFWSAARVAEALGVVAPAGVSAFTGVSTDTRAMKGGELFVALKGERFDAHDFLDQARDAGAAAAVVHRGTKPVERLPLFVVGDTLAALGQLARARRRAVTGPVIAVTGTNGKTATKEMLARVLGTKWRVHWTAANLNNLVGVPLTILNAPEDAEALVVEAGASVLGEVARLRDIIEPGIGVVTNVSAGHVAGFGSVAGVLAEKVSLLKDVPVAVVGLTPPALAERARAVARRVRTAGLDAMADVHPERWRLDAEGRPVVTFRGVDVALPLVGRHQAENAMLALAVAVELGLDTAQAGAALHEVTLPAGRSELLRLKGLTVLHDAYNANPASLAAALQAVAAMRQGRRLVVVVGTMLELGAETERRHAELADAVLAVHPDLIAAVGEFVPALERHPEVADRLITAPDADALGPKLASRLQGNELVLLKASRGVRLERVLPYLSSL